MMSEKKKGKKKNLQETGMGYCPFSFCAGSRYSKLYPYTAGLGAQQGGHDTTSSPVTRQGGPATRPACARGKR